MDALHVLGRVLLVIFVFYEESTQSTRSFAYLGSCTLFRSNGRSYYLRYLAVKQLALDGECRILQRRLFDGRLLRNWRSDCDLLLAQRV
jgi:hypothetical protein